MIVAILTLKILNTIIAIFAFATTTSTFSSSAFSFVCPETSNIVLNSLTWSYPFRLDQCSIHVTLCNGTTVERYPYGDFTAPCQFFVFVGVVTFIYCIGALILYVCFDDKYRKYDNIPVLDFLFSCVFGVFWLISTAVWTTGVTDIKEYTHPAEWRLYVVPECQTIECTVQKTGNFASLNVSLVFGYLNTCVWTGNLWFLYKETRWYKVQTEHSPTSPSEAPLEV